VKRENRKVYNPRRSRICKPMRMCSPSALGCSPLGELAWTWEFLRLGSWACSHALDHARVWLHEGQVMFLDPSTLSMCDEEGVVAGVWKRSLVLNELRLMSPQGF